MTSLSKCKRRSCTYITLEKIETLSGLLRVEKAINGQTLRSSSADASLPRFSFSGYLINGKVKDVVFRSGYRMLCTHLTATETTVVASSVPKTAVENSSDLAGERTYCMSRGDCR